jgi:hypothetical protein
MGRIADIRPAVPPDIRYPAKPLSVASLIVSRRHPPRVLSDPAHHFRCSNAATFRGCHGMPAKNASRNRSTYLNWPWVWTCIEWSSIYIWLAARSASPAYCTRGIKYCLSIIIQKVYSTRGEIIFEIKYRRFRGSFYKIYSLPDFISL